MKIKLYIFLLYFNLVLCAVKDQQLDFILVDSGAFDKLLQSEDTFFCQFFRENERPAALLRDFAKLSNIFHGLIKVAASSDINVVSKHGGDVLPSLKLFIKDKTAKYKVVSYTGKRDVESMVKFLKKQLGSLISDRLGVKKKERVDAAVLTDITFNQQVINDVDSVWFVMFYAPWCGHCKSLKPTWDLLASKLANKVKVGKVDCTTETNIARQLKIQGYPTLLLFESGTKTLTGGKHYQGQRTLEDLEKFALSFKRIVPVLQLLNDDMFNESCNGLLCIISFLPHILDSGREERIKLINVIKKAAMIGSDVPMSFLWSQGGDQYDLEMALNLSFGYPAVVALRIDKELFVTYKGPYTKDSIKKFINGLMVKINGAQKISNLKPLVTVEPWNESNDNIANSDNDNVNPNTEL